MNIGSLDKRCRIEARVATQDPIYGAEVVTWALLGVRYCSIQDEQPSRSDSVKQELVIAASRSRVRLRYCTDINTSVRLTINRPAPVVYAVISDPVELGNKDGVEFLVERYSS